MNAATITNYLAISPALTSRARASRYAIVCSLLLIPLIGGDATREAFLQSLASAYLAVTVFVALTLAMFYGLEHLLRLDTGALLQHHRRYQVPVAALLGALPGCGGAIVVMTQYSTGRAGFGAVVAVLTSTMGDAAFLLIAKEPITGFAVVSLGICVGIVSGSLIENIHGDQFLRVQAPVALPCGDPRPPIPLGPLQRLWLALLIPGGALGLLGAFQVDVNEVLGTKGLDVTLGAVGGLLSVLLWFVNPNSPSSMVNRTDTENPSYAWEKTIVDSCFVTVWVVIAFLCFDLTTLWGGWDFAALFTPTGPLVPLLGVAIGLIPGCGPQVLTTTLYLQGVIPLSAQLGNAISNDGDALFPALAVAPRASVLATLYTTVPALLVAYGYYFLAER
ncbi:MAG: putative manganese transporter [Pseudomonadota bacterium]